MRKDVGLNGDAQRTEQLVWMLFLKILDEKETQTEELKKDHVSPLKDEFRWRNWAIVSEDGGFNNRTDNDAETEKTDGLIAFVEGELFPALQDIHSYQGDSKLCAVIHSVFEDTRNYMKSGSLLRQVINKIEEDIPLKNFEDQQHLGDVYEKLLRDLQSAGNAGEFYTPRAVTEFVVDRIAPRVSETFLDPACGTGGFLAQAVDYLNKNKQDNSDETLKKIENAPRGIEKKPLPHMLAVTNMILHGIQEPYRIERNNTLDLYKDWPKDRKVDIVISNPPFGGTEEDDIEKVFPADFRTRETADLFIHFIYTKMLEDDGRCAIVLPDGFLFGEGIKSRIKEDLMEKCNLHTIVRLPNGVFSPYTNINTNILFFQKTGKTKDSTHTVWFYEHPYPEGYKSYSKTRPMRFREFQAEQEWWQDLYDTTTYENREENEFAWKVDFLTEKAEALAKAKPYYDRANEYEAERKEKTTKTRELNALVRTHRKEIKNTKSNKKKKAALDNEIAAAKESIEALKQEAELLERKAKDEQNAGDRIKYAIYNLDRNNPYRSEEEILDADKLLIELELIQASISKLQDTLKIELSNALSKEVF